MLNERGERVIRHAGMAAITALIMVSTKHSATGHAAVPTMLAVGAAAVLAARGGSMLRLLVCGGGDLRLLVILIDLVAR